MEVRLPLIMHPVKQCFKTFISESPERLNKTVCVCVWDEGIPRVSHSGGLRSCISNKFPEDAVAEGLGTTAGQALLQGARFTELNAVLSQTPYQHLHQWQPVAPASPLWKPEGSSGHFAWECVPSDTMLSVASQSSLPFSSRSPIYLSCSFPKNLVFKSWLSWWKGSLLRVGPRCAWDSLFLIMVFINQMGRIVFRMLLLSMTDNIVNTTPVEVGWKVMMLFHWTWGDSQLRAVWSLGGLGWRGQGLPLDDLVDVSYSLKDVPLVGCVWRFYFFQLQFLVLLPSCSWATGSARAEVFDMVYLGGFYFCWGRMKNRQALYTPHACPPAA